MTACPVRLALVHLPNTGANLDGLAELIGVDRVDVAGDDSGGGLLRSDVNIGDLG